MTEPRKFGGAEVLRLVLAFTFRRWRTRRGLVAGIAATMCIATLADIFLPLYAGRLIDALNARSLSAALPSFYAMVALGLMMVVFRTIAWAGIVPLTLELMEGIARDAFHRVQRLSTDWHANSFAGSTVRKITRGIWALDSLDDTLLLMLLPSTVVLGGTIVLLAFHWPIVALVMTAGAALYLAFTLTLTTRYIAPAAKLSNSWDTKLGGLLADSLGSNAVVKAFGAEPREDERLVALLAKWRKRTDRTWMRHTWSAAGQFLLLWGVRTAVTACALWLWVKGNATPGQVTYVLTTYFVIHGYLRDMGQQLHQLQRAVNDMEDLVRLFAEPHGIADAADARPIRIADGEVRFDGVTFCYGGHIEPLYRNLSVTIPAGQRVGLVGRSGSGKTTFVKLIQRLYDVTDGRILIDGQDVRGALQSSLREQIAIVQQEPILFHRTLAENIAYAKPGASQHQIEAAARLANAHDFIAALPKGYRTLVGERGVKLSGGERQRVALARAFLADAPILILDEATSSLDSESEHLIQEAIDRLLVGRTAIIIAHRLSTVRSLDRILVFDGGRIVEDGSHAELLEASDGHYRRLFERQSGQIAAPEVVIGE